MTTEVKLILKFKGNKKHGKIYLIVSGEELKGEVEAFPLNYWQSCTFLSRGGGTGKDLRRTRGFCGEQEFPFPLPIFEQIRDTWNSFLSKHRNLIASSTASTPLEDSKEESGALKR